MKRRLIRLWIALALPVFLQAPVNADWTQTSGPEGGDVYVMVNYGEYIFAGTAGGVYCSGDSGATWLPRNGGLPAGYWVMALLADGNRLFAGIRGSGVYCSMDSGASWARSNTGIPDNSMISALFRKDSALLAGTSGNGVFISVDDGAHWTASNTGLDNPYAFCFAAKGTDLFVGLYGGASINGGGVFRSRDNGSTWAAVNTGLGDFHVMSLAADSVNIFAACQFGLYVSADDGAHWAATASTGLINIRTAALKGGFLFACGLQGIRRSADNGQTWTNPGLSQTDAWSFLARGTELFAGTYGCGIFKSADNGDAWLPANSGLRTTTPVAFAGKGADLFAACYRAGVFRSADSGTTWTPVNAGFPQLYISCLSVRGGDILAGSNGMDGGLFRSGDNGASWTRSESGLTDHHVNGFSGLGRFLFAGTYAGGVFRSADDGRSWAPVNAGLTNLCVNSLAAGTSALFAGTGGGGVFRSLDSGQTWVAVNAGLTNPNVKCLFASDSVLLAGTTSYAFRSTDDGGRWDTLRYQADGFAASDTALFLGGYFAVVHGSTDNGAGWAPDSAGLSNPHVQSLAVYGPFLFAGIYDGGVWRMPLPGGTSVEKGAAPPAGLLSLAQNRPNPFRSGTTLSFSIFRQTGVSLRVFNGLGQTAADLLSRDLPAGRYTVDWDASGLSCGAYFCRLEAGGFVQTRKLLLIK